MDKNQENQVLLQLINYKTDCKQTKLLEHPFHDDKTISQISSTISDILYDPKSTKSQKKGVIDLINKWTISSHLINPKTQHIFIDILPKTSQETFTTFLGNTTKPAENLGEILTKKYEKHLQARIKSDLIDMYHKKVFENTFDVNIPVKPLQSNNAESVIDFVRNLSEIKTVSGELLTEKPFIDVDLCADTILTLLDLRCDEKIICKLMEDLSTVKTQKTVEFIKYIWNNRLKYGLNDLMQKNLLENNQFLYEKLILQYFTGVLQDFDTIDENLNEMLLCCFRNVDLSKKLFNIFDTMLILSKYDERILQAINKIKNKYL